MVEDDIIEDGGQPGLPLTAWFGYTASFANRELNDFEFPVCYFGMDSISSRGFVQVLVGVRLYTF
jgi:hypothetical protein